MVLIAAGALLSLYLWRSHGPVPGLVSLVVVVALAGVLSGFLALMLRPLLPGWRSFVKAWEARFSDLGVVWPPPLEGPYRQWRRERRRTEESAEDWLDRLTA
jgi:hypothetical protein